MVCLTYGEARPLQYVLCRGNAVRWSFVLWSGPARATAPDGRNHNQSLRLPNLIDQPLSPAMRFDLIMVRLAWKPEGGNTRRGAPLG